MQETMQIDFCLLPQESVAEMNASDQKPPPDTKPVLNPQAQRALDEARQRREKTDKEAKSLPPEIEGRNGPEPTRYGDWEKNGIISDF
jgi:hypothetical protein